MHAIKSFKNSFWQIYRKEKGILLFLFFWLGFYLFFQTQTIYGGDAGDLVSAAVTWGIPHPPGYPLYTFLAALLIKIPINTIAWRASLLSSIPSAFTLTILFIIIRKLTKNSLTAIMAVSFLGFSYPFWLYSIVPEVFSLNNLLAILLIYLALSFNDLQGIEIYYSNLWLMTFILGISICHHHTVLFILPGIIFLLTQQSRQLKKN